MVESTGRVFVAEDEESVDALAEIGVSVTTSACGAGQAHETDWTPLAGREVVIFPKNDENGEAYTLEVPAILTRLAPAARARIVLLPDLPPKGGIVEFLESRDAKTSEEICEEIEALADSAETIENDSPSPEDKMKDKITAPESPTTEPNKSNQRKTASKSADSSNVQAESTPEEETESPSASEAPPPVGHTLVEGIFASDEVIPPDHERKHSPSIDLADEANRLHIQIIGRVKSTVFDAVRIGELLSKQKAMLPHGQWLRWVKDHLQFRERTAREYMQFHTNREQLKSARCADFGEARKLLSPPRAPTNSKRSVPPKWTIPATAEGVFNAFTRLDEQAQNRFRVLLAEGGTDA